MDKHIQLNRILEMFHVCFTTIILEPDFAGDFEVLEHPVGIINHKIILHNFHYSDVYASFRKEGAQLNDASILLRNCFAFLYIDPAPVQKKDPGILLHTLLVYDDFLFQAYAKKNYLPLQVGSEVPSFLVTLFREYTSTETVSASTDFWTHQNPYKKWSSSNSPVGIWIWPNKKGEWEMGDDNDRKASWNNNMGKVLI